MSMTCEELVDLLIDFVGGDLEAAQRTALEQHLCGCKTCVVSVELYKATITVTRALPRCEAPLPPAVEARLRAAISAAPTE